MGKSDAYQFDYLDDNEHFADQVNGALFKGRQVVKPEELMPADAQAVYLGEEAGVRKNYKTVADKVRLWKKRLIHILAVENQTFVDYHMVLRNMLTEALNYQKQWKQKKRDYEREKDLETGTDAFLSGMDKDEKFIPVITLVVYCGTEHSWNGPRCLYDLLDVDKELKKFVTNYKLNLYDCHEHDTFDEYKTGLRQLFEVVRYNKEKEKLKTILTENREIYSRIDSDTRELLEVVGKIRFGKEHETVENGERKYDMCKAFMDMKLEGIEEGRLEGKLEGIQEGRLEGKLEERREHLIQTVCKKLLKNKPAIIIADELEEELAAVENIIRIQRQLGNYDVRQIYEVMQAEQPAEINV